MEAKSIIPVWQPVGYSTHLISQRIAEKLGEKTSHTGTLDPMAEGIVIVLSGKTRLKKKSFAKWKKTYLFEITFGLATDTFDGMGLITEKDFSHVSKRVTQETLKRFVGDYEQNIPAYATKKINGKHLHEYARAGQKIKNQKKKGKIFSLALIDFKKKDTNFHINHQIEKINKVTGDFRQEKITKNWKDFLNSKNKPENLQTAKMQVTTSKGIYVRSLAVDIAQSLSTTGFASEIVRIQNGRFKQEDSAKLADIFSPQELKSDYLHSKP